MKEANEFLKLPAIETTISWCIFSAMILVAIIILCVTLEIDKGWRIVIRLFFIPIIILWIILMIAISKSLF